MSLYRAASQKTPGSPQLQHHESLAQDMWLTIPQPIAIANAPQENHQVFDQDDVVTPKYSGISSEQINKLVA
jgi:hypothetical protein